MSLTGTLVAESLKPGATLEVPFAVRCFRRVEAGDPTAEQPEVWTLIEFVVTDDFAEPLLAELAEALAPGPWYCDAASTLETAVVFSGRVFTYRRGDVAGRRAAEDHARSVGVPEAQLDWPE